jgi:FkbM family methyltransferase
MPPRFLHPLLIRYLRGPNHPSKLRLLNASRGWLRDLECAVRPGLRMRLDYGDMLQEELLLGRDHEPLTLALLERLLAPGDCFVDVGTNVGFFSLIAAARVGPSGRVVSIEPNPVALAKLRANFALNPALRTEIVPAAVSDAVGEVRLAQPDPRNLGGVRIDAHGTVAVRCAPLGELVPDLRNRPPKLVKIDVESHEPAVLRGIFASPWLRPRHIVFEYKPSFFPVADPEGALWRPLRAAGYELKNIEGRPLFDDLPEDNVWAEHAGSTPTP